MCIYNMHKGKAIEQGRKIQETVPGNILYYQVLYWAKILSRVYVLVLVTLFFVEIMLRIMQE